MIKIITFILILLPLFSFAQGAQGDSYKGTTTGTNSYSVTINAITASAPYDGQKILVKFANGNTAASTLVVSGAGIIVYAIKDIETNAGSALTTGIIMANSEWYLAYNSSFNSWQIIGGSVTGSSWNLIGNSGTVDGTNFIGTTDDVPFNIRVNNVKSGRIDNNSNNTFFGYSSGNGNTSGIQNTAIGFGTLQNNLTGTQNTAVGGRALQSNLGNQNTAVGNRALQNNSSGLENTAIGSGALQNNLTGNQNTAVGSGALQDNLGIENTAIGSGALLTNSTGTQNTAVGFGALENNSSGLENTAIGSGALKTNSTGTANVAIGRSAGYYETGSNKLFIDNNGRVNEADGRIKAMMYGVFSSAIATQSVTINGQLRINDGTGATGKVLTYKADGFSEWATPATGGAWTTTGNAGTTAGTNFIGTTDNIDLIFKRSNIHAGLISGKNSVSFGTQSLNSTFTGLGNSAFGHASLSSLTSGADNTGIGSFSLTNITSGVNNTAIGESALRSLTTSNSNVAIGYGAGYHETGSDKLFIDNAQRINEADARIKAMMYGVFGSTVATQLLTINGQLRINDGTGATGRVLTYKADGFSEWTAITSNATHTGDATGATALTIANDAVTYAKFQNVTTNRLLGRSTAGSGDMEEIILGTNLSFTGNTLNAAGGGGGGGTVTSVSVVTANGVSGSVATSTTTPAITLTLGAITPTSVNNNIFVTPITTSTLTIEGDAYVAGFNSGDQLNIIGNSGSSGTSTIVDDNSTNAVMNLVWVTTNIGNLPFKVSTTGLRFNPSNDRLGIGIATPLAGLHVNNGHIKSEQTTAPTYSITTANGISAVSVTAGSTDTKGLIETTGIATNNSSYTVLTITFNTAYNVAPVVCVTPWNSAGSAGKYNAYCSTTTLTLAIEGKGQETPKFNYIVIE